MKILGIVAEYNPFHTGHFYHLNKAKEMICPDYTVIVMSSSFVQRGEPAIINKWTRSHIAVLNGADLVIELPLVCSVESADYFAHYSIRLLNEMGVTDLVFGSEDGHIETFTDIAHTINDKNNQYNHLIKHYMNEGYRYADATNQALGHLMNRQIRTPNDLLGLAYVKEIISHQYLIKPHVIRRTNDYHSAALTPIASATALRTALKDHKDVGHYLPGYEFYKHDHLYDFNDFYKQLRYAILFNDHLKDIHMVDEGLENLLFRSIQNSSDIDELIAQMTSRRYTRARISRMLVHILLNNRKKDVAKAMAIDYIRLLAFNDRGRQLIKSRKAMTSFKIITSINQYEHPALTIERKAARLLSLVDPKQDFLEYSSIPYIRSKEHR